jgi:hypothetical protein
MDTLVREASLIGDDRILDAVGGGVEMDDLFIVEETVYSF